MNKLIGELVHSTPPKTNKKPLAGALERTPYNEKGLYHMPAKSAKTTDSDKSGGTNFEKESKAFLASHPFEFANIALGEDEKDAIQEAPCTPERLAEFVKEVVIHQYKLGINWDNKHSCYVVSITGAKFFRDDYNRCVTSRHNQLWIAIAIAEYKFFKFIASFGIESTKKATGEIFD